MSFGNVVAASASAAAAEMLTDVVAVAVVAIAVAVTLNLFNVNATFSTATAASVTRLSYFWKVLITNLGTKVAQLFGKFLGIPFEKHHFLNRNCLG